MRITIAAVTPRKQRLKSGPLHELVREYVERCARYVPTETVFFDTEAALLQGLGRASGRVPAHFVALDSRGRGLDSEAIAKYLGRTRDGGAQEMMFAIGPADGWSDEARVRANLVLSLGAITLPHELALVVLAEQIYRAQSILAGHPYHSGH
jgi:23S rRNA (pseudouridine1915-N3)-methyltransferase